MKKRITIRIESKKPRNPVATALASSKYTPKAFAHPKAYKRQKIRVIDID